MSGEPVVRGTRVQAYLRAGYTKVEKFQDYPTLPVDGVEAVVRWAETEIGADWRAAPE